MIEPNYTYKGHITNVVDGDTLDIIIDLGFHMQISMRLRLNRVNTPELHAQSDGIKAKAQIAKDYTEKTVLGKDVVIITEKSDAFGRYLAEVFYLNIRGEQCCLNDDLLRLKLAVPYKRKK